MEAADERELPPLVDADGVEAAAGRGGVASAQGRSGGAAPIAGDRVVLELLRGSTVALLAASKGMAIRRIYIIEWMTLVPLL